MDLFKIAAKDITVDWMHKETETEQHFTRIYENRWGTAEGQSAEELRGEYRQRLIAEDETVSNVHLQQNAIAQQGNADADDAAPGAPKLDQAAAKKTRKQQREDRRRDNKAKKISNNQNADHVSYNMVERLQARKNAADKYINGNRFRRNSEEQAAWAKQVKDADVNPDLLKAFYKEGGTFIDDYTRAEALQRTGKAMVYEKEEREARTRALDGIVNDMIETEITPEMFKPAYLELHIDEMKALADRMRYFRDICADRNNSFYFENEKKDIGIDTRVKLLNAKLELTDVLCAQLDYAAAQKAVDVGKGDYIRGTQQDMLTADLLQNEGQTTVQRQDQENVLTQKLQELQQKEESIYAGAVEQELQEKLVTVREEYRQEEAEQLEIKLLQSEIAAKEHAENYQKYQGAVDSIFLEECRMGDIRTEAYNSMKAYELANTGYQGKQTYVDKRMAKLISAKQKESEKRFDEGERNRETYKAALDYYLKGGDAAVKQKSLTKPVRELIFTNAMESGHMAELMERTFHGENGSVENSNLQYDQRSKNDNIQLRQARSAAITEFSFRTSGSLEDRVATSLSQDALKGAVEEELGYYRQKCSSKAKVDEVANANHVKAEAVTDEMKKAFLTDEASREMMDKFHERFTGEAGMEYMRTMLPYVKDARVFQEDSARIESENAMREEGKKEITNTAVAMLAQNLMLKFVGRGFNAASQNMETEKDVFQMCKTVNSKMQKVAA